MKWKKRVRVLIKQNERVILLLIKWEFVDVRNELQIVLIFYNFYIFFVWKIFSFKRLVKIKLKCYKTLIEWGALIF